MKILIIKLGYSETLDPEMGKVTSLGDVLRTTPLLTALLELHPSAQITWLVDEAAFGLLAGNMLIHRILVADAFVPFQLMREKFDIVINLEKHPGVCALADMVDAWARYGFRFDAASGTYLAYEKGQAFIDYIRDKGQPLSDRSPWQQNLIEMLGLEWKEQPYVLGYQPGTEVRFDVGLNHLVGSKWPTKRMPEARWAEVANALEARGLSVSWQEGLDNIQCYCDWLSSCRVVLTQDSLGLHLALALKRRVVGLFGPSDPQEVFLYGSGELHRHEGCPHMPCCQPHCAWEEHCMSSIATEPIIEAVLRQLQAGER
ncbi:MAG: glycosyltransferase family 9 protein [Proteobacteria bacterium]|nr:glycosyltransferase family 9 protein [Pseudomonadota bacterium]